MANRGLSLDVPDAETIAAALIVILNGGSPEMPTTMGTIVDTVFAILTIAGLLILVYRLLHSTSWAHQNANRTLWRNVVSFIPYFIPVLLLYWYPSLLSYIFGGRDGSWLQIIYLSVSLFVLLSITSLLSLIVISLRFTQLLRIRK